MPTATSEPRAWSGSSWGPWRLWGSHLERLPDSFGVVLGMVGPRERAVRDSDSSGLGLTLGQLSQVGWGGQWDEDQAPLLLQGSCSGWLGPGIRSQWHQQMILTLCNPNAWVLKSQQLLGIEKGNWGASDSHQAPCHASSL